jgi:hypothetical protein
MKLYLLKLARLRAVKLYLLKLPQPRRDKKDGARYRKVLTANCINGKKASMDLVIPLAL